MNTEREEIEVQSLPQAKRIMRKMKESYKDKLS